MESKDLKGSTQQTTLLMTLCIFLFPLANVQARFQDLILTGSGEGSPRRTRKHQKNANLKLKDKISGSLIILLLHLQLPAKLFTGSP